MFPRTVLFTSAASRTSFSVNNFKALLFTTIKETLEAFLKTEFEGFELDSGPPPPPML
jgi:hypothetical protein